MLAAFSGKRNVTVWHLSVCLSVCLSRRHTHRDSPGGNNKEDRHTCWLTIANFFGVFDARVRFSPISLVSEKITVHWLSRDVDYVVMAKVVAMQYRHPSDGRTDTGDRASRGKNVPLENRASVVRRRVFA